MNTFLHVYIFISLFYFVFFLPKVYLPIKLNKKLNKGEKIVDLVLKVFNVKFEKLLGINKLQNYFLSVSFNFKSKNIGSYLFKITYLN